MTDEVERFKRTWREYKAARDVCRENEELFEKKREVFEEKKAELLALYDRMPEMGREAGAKAMLADPWMEKLLRTEFFGDTDSGKEEG